MSFAVSIIQSFRCCVQRMELNWFHCSFVFIPPSLSFNFTLHSISTRWMGVKWRKRVAPFNSFRLFASLSLRLNSFHSRSSFVSLLSFQSFTHYIGCITSFIHLTQLLHYIASTSLSFISPSLLGLIQISLLQFIYITFS